jgi:hypothetical protein
MALEPKIEYMMKFYLTKLNQGVNPPLSAKTGIKTNKKPANLMISRLFVFRAFQNIHKFSSCW